MDSEGKYYEPPRVWPGVRELDGQLSVIEGYPFPYLAKSEGYLLGLFFGLDKTGVIQIDNLLKTNKAIKCKLIIGIYPACASCRQDLEALLEMQNKFTDRVDFRLYIINSINSGVSSSLLFIDKNSNNSTLSTGPFLGFNSRPIDPSLTSFVFHPETALLKPWTDWFDYIWVKYSIPLNFITTQIPELVPVEASERVVNMWNSYLQRCQQFCEYGEKNDVATIEIKKSTGEIVVRDQSGKEIPPPTKELGISKISPMVERISRLYSSGKLVSFNKLTRVPPLDCPARAEWFGEESLRVEGTVTKETRYRISALDNEELKKINNLKNNGNSLLRRL